MNRKALMVLLMDNRWEVVLIFVIVTVSLLLVSGCVDPPPTKSAKKLECTPVVGQIRLE